jgi:hypothetical protein
MLNDRTHNTVTKNISVEEINKWLYKVSVKLWFCSVCGMSVAITSTVSGKFPRNCEITN